MSDYPMIPNPIRERARMLGKTIWELAFAMNPVKARALLGHIRSQVDGLEREFNDWESSQKEKAPDTEGLQGTVKPPKNQL